MFILLITKLTESALFIIILTSLTDDKIKFQLNYHEMRMKLIVEKIILFIFTVDQFP